MFTRSRLRIGRWPRRLAALSCLALAGLAAVRPAPGRSSDAAAASLAAGQRAVPVTLVVDPHDYLHPGDVVELLAAPDPDAGVDPAPPGPAAVIATRAQVLSIPSADGAVRDIGWPLIVAVDETTARQLAGVGDRLLLAVMGNSP